MAQAAAGHRRGQGRDRAAPPFYAVTPFTMLDYPDRIACILWVAGCNMRCGYCHNPQIVLGKGTISQESAIAFLQRRIGLLDGVVLSGGEATTWPGLARFAAQVKALGYAVKLDTNGLRPDIVARLLESRLVDRIALDYKAPPSRFRQVTATGAYARFSRTLDQLCGQSIVPFDVRTTFHSGVMEEDDLLAIAGDLAARGYQGPYAIQRAVVSQDRPTLGRLPAGTALNEQRLVAESPIELHFR